MTLQEWKTKTDGGKLDWRSSQLKDVDRAFETYSNAKTNQNLEKLDKALADWKLYKGAQAWYGSKRYAAAQELTEWLREMKEGNGTLLTASQMGWTLRHNCYAYAMKDMSPKRAPSGGHAGPGNKAANAVPGDTQQEKYVQGVLADAAAQNKAVRIAERSALAVPGRLTVGQEYLVAMLASQVGFHFLRRNEHTGFWTHKNSGHGGVEASIYDHRTQQYVNLTDEVVGDLMANAPQRPKLGTGNMTFQAYFAVVDGGIKVGSRDMVLADD